MTHFFIYFQKVNVRPLRTITTISIATVVPSKTITKVTLYLSINKGSIDPGRDRGINSFRERVPVHAVLMRQIPSHETFLRKPIYHYLWRIDIALSSGLSRKFDRCLHIIHTRIYTIDVYVTSWQKAPDVNTRLVTLCLMRPRARMRYF